MGDICLIFNIISLKDMIGGANYKPSNCWEAMNCPKDFKKNAGS